MSELEICILLVLAYLNGCVMGWFLRHDGHFVKRIETKESKWHVLKDSLPIKKKRLNESESNI